MTDASEIFSTIMKLVEIVFIPFGWYAIKAINNINEEARMIRTVLIGADGKNGMRSRLRRLERKVEALALAQASRYGESAIKSIEEDDEEEE